MTQLRPPRASAHCRARHSGGDGEGERETGWDSFTPPLQKNLTLYYSFPLMLRCTNGTATHSVQYYHSLGGRGCWECGGSTFSDVVPRSAALISILLCVFVLFFLSLFFFFPARPLVVVEAACAPVIVCVCVCVCVVLALFACSTALIVWQLFPATCLRRFSSPNFINASHDPCFFLLQHIQRGKDVLLSGQWQSANVSL